VVSIKIFPTGYNFIVTVSADAFDGLTNLNDAKFHANDCLDSDFKSVAEIVEELNRGNCKPLTTVQDGKELRCERSMKSIPYGYSNAVPTCFLNKATSIAVQDAQVKSDFNATYVTFFDNKNITYMPLGLSKTFPFLQIIQATYCNVKKIGPENFAGLKYIAVIWFGSNKIEDIPSGTFKGLASLTEIDLRKIFSHCSTNCHFN
jgi:Leucine rich repeat